MSIVEKMARAIFEHWQFQGRMAGTMAGSNPIKWIKDGNSFKQEEASDYARAALTATGLTEDQLEGLANGTHVVVPVEPTRKMLNAAIDTDSFKLGDISPLGFRISPQMMFERCWRAMLAAKEG